MNRSTRRITATLAAIASALSLTAIGSTAQAATPTAPAFVPFVVADPPAPTPHGVAMGDYPVSTFALPASRLPAELVQALATSTGQTAAQYLAQSAAATDAAAVVSDLTAQGADVLGSHLDGTHLTVNIADPADAARVVAAGATPVVGAPATPHFDTSNVSFAQDIHGGEAFYYETPTGTGWRCSIGFNGKGTGGVDQWATAGHCQNDLTAGDDPNYYWLQQNHPSSTSTDYTLFAGSELGTKVPNAFQVGSGNDVGLVNTNKTGAAQWNPVPQVVTWHNGTGAPDTATNVTDEIPPVQGATLCKSGSTTGWTCGQIVGVDQSVQVGGTYTINSIVTKACIQPGDSGGSGLVGNAAVGIVSWSANLACTDPNYVSGLFPLVSTDSTKATVQKRFGSAWEPYVAVSTPTVATPANAATVAIGSSLTGTLPQGNVRHSVSVVFDGTTTRTAAVDSSGNWSVSLSGLAPGPHSYTVQGTWGSWSSSAVLSARTLTIVGATVTGTVQGAADPSPVNVAGICVDAVSGPTVVATSAPSDASGAYSIPDLPAGSYTLHFIDCPSGGQLYEDEWFDDQDTQATSTTFGLTAGQTVVKNAVLPVAGPFADVRTRSPFFTQIGWMYTQGISTGYVVNGVRTYHTTDAVSRQAMAAFLYRMAGSPSFTPPTTPTFTDVAADSPFFTAVEWMYATGISTGTVNPDSTRSYNPLGAVSRQAMAAFLFRFNGSPASFTAPSTPSFADVPADSTYFRQIEWMKSTGISTGYVSGGVTTYHPLDPVTRQAMAAFLNRYANLPPAG